MEQRTHFSDDFLYQAGIVKHIFTLLYSKLTLNFEKLNENEMKILTPRLFHVN